MFNYPDNITKLPFFFYEQSEAAKKILEKSTGTLLLCSGNNSGIIICLYKVISNNEFLIKELIIKIDDANHILSTTINDAKITIETWPNFILKLKQFEKTKDNEFSLIPVVREYDLIKGKAIFFPLPNVLVQKIACIDFETLYTITRVSKDFKNAFFKPYSNEEFEALRSNALKKLRPTQSTNMLSHRNLLKIALISDSQLDSKKDSDSISERTLRHK